MLGLRPRLARVSPGRRAIRATSGVPVPVTAAALPSQRVYRGTGKPYGANVQPRSKCLGGSEEKRIHEYDWVMVYLFKIHPRLALSVGARSIYGAEDVR